MNVIKMNNIKVIVFALLLISFITYQTNISFINHSINVYHINSSINKAINFLYENQLDYGEFKTLACTDIYMQNCYFDSSPFITTFVLYSIKDIKDKKVEIMTNKAIDFLLDEKESGGIWRFWTSRNTQTIPPDLDDISTISFILKFNNISFDNNLELISDNKNNDNLFFTWITDRKNKEDVCCFMNKTFKNDVDCLVNSNVLLYLGQNDPYVCSYINNAIIFNKTCSLYYYPNALALFYMVSRAFENNVTCFKEAKNKITTTILNYQNKDGSFGSDLDTAFALNSLLNFNYVGNAIDLGISSLLKNQFLNGSWKKSYFFIEPARQLYFGSEELTTALVIEAMKKYVENNK